MKESLLNEGYEKTGVVNIPMDILHDILQKFSNDMEYGEDNLQVYPYGVYRASMDYRDSANYRHSVQFALDEQSDLWMIEPDWNEDEEEERILFHERFYEFFNIPVPQHIYG